jgi:hypothetical protein
MQVKKISLLQAILKITIQSFGSHISTQPPKLGLNFIVIQEYEMVLISPTVSMVLFAVITYMYFCALLQNRSK